MKVDLSYLREMSGGNKELVLEMISIFKTQVDEFGRDMDQLLAEEKHDQLGKLAHKAKSSVSIMGLNELAIRLKELENSACAGKNIASYKGIIDLFKQETKDAVKELEMVTQNIELYF